MAEYDFSTLREYQKQSVLGVEAAWGDGHRSVLLQSPTGSGKSRIIRTIVDRLHSERQAVYVVAHRGNLIRQLSAELSSVEIRHGIIKAGFPHIRYRVQVCSVQTLSKRLDRMDEPALVVYDESHHASASQYQAIVKQWPECRVLGVTATPKRMTGLPLSDTFSSLVPGPSVRYLIDNGFLSDFEYLAPSSVPVHGVDDNDTERLMELVGKRAIIGDAVDHYRVHSDHLPAIVACVTIEHAKMVADEFSAAGYRFKAIHSLMQEEEVARLIRELGDGTIDGLTNCDLIGEGTDIPVVTTLIGLRPTGSLTVFLQYCGRVLRRHPNKERAIILDHVGNYLRHGLPDDDRDWSLDADSGKLSDVSRYKLCPDCFRADIPKAARFCPYCFESFAGGEAAASRIPQQVDGQLVDVRARRYDHELIVRIAREAQSFDRAVELAGSRDMAGWIWFDVLRNPA